MANSYRSMGKHPRIISLPVVLAVMMAAGLTLGGCGGVIVGGAATTATAASQERGLDGAITDARIQTEINHGWLQSGNDLFRALSSFVYEGRVMLTGLVKSEDSRTAAIAMAWKVRGVKEVINVILVDPSGKTGTYARDTWITAQIKSKLLFDQEIISINYSVDSLRHTVYLFGVAQNKQELDRVINIARNIKYVERVVNHVLLKADQRRK
ncbi:MAG: osmotically-inducible protein OsmY [Alphaproteobacteria bacterium]|jgi:osmotically-inducible protein OsmY